MSGCESSLSLMNSSATWAESSKPRHLLCLTLLVAVATSPQCLAMHLESQCISHCSGNEICLLLQLDEMCCMMHASKRSSGKRNALDDEMRTSSWSTAPPAAGAAPSAWAAGA